MDNYLFFSSLELIDYFLNNLQRKYEDPDERIFEMARVFMAKKDFALKTFTLFSVMVKISNSVKK
jgi:2-iminobutanoate/2-iminopropanoate deaminase